MNKIIMLVGLASVLFVAGVTQAAEVHVMTPCHGATSVQQPSVGATTDGVITKKYLSLSAESPIGEMLAGILILNVTKINR